MLCICAFTWVLAVILTDFFYTWQKVKFVICMDRQPEPNQHRVCQTKTENTSFQSNCVHSAHQVAIPQRDLSKTQALLASLISQIHWR
ncbi:hypothetical protein BC940DRAFT_294074 [Gongronella butleri]|nr:hypothetical protein BC940DRAFT_294074 [Gongronella butleri]